MRPAVRPARLPISALVLLLLLTGSGLPGGPGVRSALAQSASPPSAPGTGGADWALPDGPPLPEPAEPAATVEPVEPAGPESAQASASGSDVLTLAAPKSVMLGRPFAVRLTSGRPLREVTAHWQGRDVILSIALWNDKQVALTVLGTDVGRDTPGPLPLVVTADVDGRQAAFERTIDVTPGRYPDLAGAAVPGESAAPRPAPEDRERILTERRALAAALAGIAPQRRWTLPLLAPSSGEIAVPYGTRSDAAGAAGPHRLVDILAAAGEPVRAAAAGTVTLVGTHRFSGETVVIDHGLGLCTLYFHLSETRVTQGQSVERGQVVGLAGASGSAAGPAISFGAAVLGRLVDPEPLLTGSADTLTGE